MTTTERKASPKSWSAPLLVALSLTATLCGWAWLATSEAPPDAVAEPAPASEVIEPAAMSSSSPELAPIPALVPIDTRLPARRMPRPDVVTRASRR